MDDIINIILSLTNNEFDLYSLLRVCKKFNKYFQLTENVYHWKKRFISPIREIMREFKHEYKNFTPRKVFNWNVWNICKFEFGIYLDNPNNPNWDYVEISKHHSISLNIIKLYPNIPWNRSGLLKNKNITIENIMDNPDLPWGEFTEDNISDLACNPNITLEFVLDHIDIKWDWGILSLNICFNEGELKTYKNLPWEHQMMTKNKSITIKDILDNIEFRWNFSYILTNFPLTDELFEKVPFLYSQISLNINLTDEFIMNNISDKWDFIALSQNSALTPQIVLNNSNFKWCVEHLMVNSNFTHENLLELGININYNFLSRNPNITWDLVMNNLDKPWNYRSLLFNRGINPDDIFNFVKYLPFDHFWSYSQNLNDLYKNPNLRARHIRDHPEITWNWAGIGSVNF